ncbi:MAG: tripartite tricarboxylate transporter substrate binding protein [Burkholderiales bacterium]|nr:tripartite tricarboxylate transporter substrate binding protein [Burkholderiales bacterium]
MKRLLAAAVTLGLAAAAAGASAQTYPAKPIRILVGFAPGGGVDLIGRVIAQKLNEAFNQPVIVENRTGAGGNIATDAAAKAAPDGYTLLMGYVGNLAINPFLYGKLPYDPERDFTPIALAAVSTNLLVAHPSLPIRSVKDLVAFARARPDQVNYASAGVGTVGHMAAELLATTAGVRIQHIPYKGNGAAIADVLSGQVPLIFSAPGAVVHHVRSGRLRGIATASERRPSGLEDIPTFAESGYPAVEASAWYAVFGPAGLAPAIVERLNGEIVRGLKQPDTAARLTNAGYDPAPSTPQQLAELLKRDLGKWAKVVKASGAKAQ